MSDFNIDELVVPASLDDEGAGDFIEMVAVRNRVESDILGTEALSWTAEGLIPIVTSNAHRGRRHFVARIDGRIVARAVVTYATRADAPEANIQVDVLPDYRGRGLGTALLNVAEETAASLGRSVLQAEMPHTLVADGVRVPSPTGFGDVSAEDPGVRFLMHHGYVLEMVNRISQLDLSAGIEAAEEQGRIAADHAGPAYDVVSWVGETPPEHLDDVARLKTAMSTDAPSAGMEATEDVWDAERLRQADILQSGTGRVLFTTAARHVPSGRLVAYTEIGVPHGDAQPATQEDTLVIKSHRGHRLGLLVKAVNIQQLVAAAPGTTVISTFNAEDNVPMLTVNVALGFRPIGTEGAWQKDLR